MTEFELKKGTKVEVNSEEEGFQGAWFTATIVTPPTKTTKKVLVEYETLLQENGVKPLREKVDLLQIRPTPPRETNKVFNFDDQVDAYYNDCWWEGVITKVLGGFRYCVYFITSGEQTEFNVSDLRLHREWVNYKWVPPIEEEAQSTEENLTQTQEVRPTEENIHYKEENPFREGSQVEVSSDEEGFEGAWFAANIVEVLGNDKFLVEYRDLTTEDKTQFVREEVDTFHIRPCPPKAEKLDKFKQYDEVDALYNDGWWVGIISKVLRSRYKVYFKTSDEEMEFKHDELRTHQDWTDGKWIVASEAINLTQ